MSEDANQVETTSDPANGEPAVEAEPTVESLKAEAEKWKKFSRQHEERAKSNAAAATELQAIKDQQKTAEERATEELAKAKADAANATQQLLRYEVANAKGVPAALLTGTSKEDLEKQADDLLSWRGVQEQQPVSTQVPSLRQGPQGPPPSANNPSVNDLMRKAAGF